MKKTLMATLVVSLIAPAAAVAGERKITVPTPKSITLICSDDVRPGTVVLTNPPKFSCKDYELVKSAVGMGITIGPDTKVEEIKAAFRREKRNVRITKMRSEGRLRETGPGPTPRGQHYNNTMTKDLYDSFKPIPQTRFTNWEPRKDRLKGLSYEEKLRVLREMAVQNRRDYWEAWDKRNGTFADSEGHEYFGKGIRRNRSFFND